MSIQVVFPMAGLGSRFGYKFKPFIKATEDTFIEIAKTSFDTLDTASYIFVFRNSQEDEHHVTAKLGVFFPNDIITTHFVDDTDGPFQTLYKTVCDLNLSGPTFVCDCDHKVDIQPMMDVYNRLTQEGQHDFVIIPTWSISEDEYPSWGKVGLDKNNKVVAFCEKEYMGNNATIHHVKGMIGCYLFSDISCVLKYKNTPQNISDVLKLMLEKRGSDIQTQTKLVTIDIQEAHFFGTPKLLENYRFQRAKMYTLFVDIDGTLVHQTTKDILPGVLDKIVQWRNEGHKVVLTTAVKSNMRNQVMNILIKHGIPYDALYMDVTPGPRISINDRKPYLPFYSMADGIEVDRNQGLVDVCLPAPCPTIVHQLSGASFAKVYLVKDDTKVFVRKHILKSDKNTNIHVEKLKRQLEDMKRFDFMSPGIVPKVLGSYESRNEFYYDMEYLSNHRMLSSYDTITQIQVVTRITKDLSESIYCYKKPIANPRQWLDILMTTKVYPRICDMSLPFANDAIDINGIYHEPISALFANLEQYYDKFAPEFESPIHGDLTLENIMYDDDIDDYKLIDNDGSRYFDAPELDLGKLFQSLVAKYALWKDDCGNYIHISTTQHIRTLKTLYSFELDEVFVDVEMHMDEVRQIIECYYNLCVEERDTHALFTKALFYTCTHLVRMIPYVSRVSKGHLMFLDVIIRVYLRYILVSQYVDIV